jgi:D-alanyl-D-alanine carboxypeptidase (penicillin-binding protein 5/6)
LKFVRYKRCNWLKKLSTVFFLAIYYMVSVSPTTVFAVNTPIKEPQIRGEGAYLIDVLSGQALYMKNPDKPLAPASTTKIMTALLAIERGNLDDIVTVSSTMLNNKIVYGTQIYLTPGETMHLKDLLYALLLNSANDAAVVIAEHIGGNLENFVKMMNERARELGATQTHFLNPSGLTETGQFTTAHDLAIIARAAIQNPTFAEYVRTRLHTIPRSNPDTPTLMVNANKLLGSDSSVDGIKTGYTAAAQNCLVLSATRNGRQLIGVILKSPGPEIYTDMQAMMDYGFTQFTNTVFKSSGAVISTIMVNNEPVDLIIDRPIYITQKINEISPGLNLRVRLISPNPLSSVTEGQVVAQVEVLDGQTLIDTLPLKTNRTIMPNALSNSIFVNYFPYIIGFLCIVFSLLIGQKKYAAWRWRKQMRLMRRRESIR